MERVAMCFKRTAASQPHAIDATLTRRPHRCGWRNCRRSHPRRCSRGPCAICGEGSHATRFHTDFEAYIAAQRPRPPMEPEGEDVEAMMRGLGMRGDAAGADAGAAAGCVPRTARRLSRPCII